MRRCSRWAMPSFAPATRRRPRKPSSQRRLSPGQQETAGALAKAALGYGGRYVWMAARGDPHVIPLLEEALSSLPTGDSASARDAHGAAFRRDPGPAVSRSAPAAERGGRGDGKASGRRREPSHMRSTPDASRSSDPRRASSSARPWRRSCASARPHDDPDRFLQSHLYRMLHQFQLGDMPAGWPRSRDRDPSGRGVPGARLPVLRCRRGCSARALRGPFRVRAGADPARIRVRPPRDRLHRGRLVRSYRCSSFIGSRARRRTRRTSCGSSPLSNPPTRSCAAPLRHS